MRIHRALIAFWTIITNKDYIFSNNRVRHIYGDIPEIVNQSNDIVQSISDAVYQEKVLEQAKQLLK